MMAFGVAALMLSGFGWIPRRDKSNMAADTRSEMQNTTRMLREALERVAPVGRHAIVIGEALRNGGLLDVPEEKNEFRAFVDATGYVTTAEKPADLAEIMKQLPPGTPEPDPEGHLAAFSAP